MDKKKWKTKNRNKVYSSNFLNVYEDVVELSNGKIINDYTLIEKPDVVVIVATDQSGNILFLNEFKYGAGKYLNCLPAGHIEKGENPIDTARRELLEETGFSGDNFYEIGLLHEYPSKDMHKVHVIGVKNIRKVNQPQHEDTEFLTFDLISPDNLRGDILAGKWYSSSSLASLLISGIFF